MRTSRPSGSAAQCCEIQLGKSGSI